LDATTFIDELKKVFEANAYPKNAEGQKAYMKNNFDFLGLSSPVRRQLQKPFLVQKYLPTKEDMKQIVVQLWNEPYREYQYFAQELAYQYLNNQEMDDIELYEYMIVHKSWWDTVDFIAPKLTGDYFNKFTDKQKPVIDKWLDSGNIWLQRSAVLFQLKYKEETDTELLAYIIQSLVGTNEFFVNKAIGWMLREYGKINPEWVIDFVKKNIELDKLSKREALRIIHKI